ncbi:hypothetical protein W97_08641 [Coniosporium apollinis CBS 100218]|uniref:Uncharacterized protein n=1 Tax=Coniosporium apollinis (strain CBS 100218) TaxID=1168221 RepID=R7Z616_CONA1|nr:uncharacterized protein W97_08641 [Coniosporium apollinis CBS 100218]EON69381.1 hypothetical protein W97_08641 [Coniosporium apollinis CBS 100218]
MTLTLHLSHQIRRYSQRVPQDPKYRLKAYAVMGYCVAAFTLPFVPPLLETRRSRADGSYLTKKPLAFCPSPLIRK